MLEASPSKSLGRGHNFFPDGIEIPLAYLSISQASVRSRSRDNFDAPVDLHQYLIAMLSKYELVLLLKFREGYSRGHACEGVVDY